MKQERFIKKRVVPTAFLILSTLCNTFLLGFRTELSLDIIFNLFFLDLIFLAVFIYFLGEQRISGQLPYGEANTYTEIVLVYILGLFVSYICSYLPEYSNLAFGFAIAMTLVSNVQTALIAGIFQNILFAVATTQDLHSVIAFLLLTVLGVMLTQACQKNRLHLWVHLLAFFGTIVIVSVSYYTQYSTVEWKMLFIFACNAALNLAGMELAVRFLQPKLQELEETSLTRILEKNYPLVQAIQGFSEIDYTHAVKVSNLCSECAKQVHAKEELCRAAGFYYRLGRMEGEPYIENGVILAENVCFPPDLIQILKEYNGILSPISTKESAIVHMVDRIVTKLDLLDKSTFSSNWNQDMVIYQTLNEESATGIYDESGLGMNQFLIIREFLVKGEQLF